MVAKRTSRGLRLTEADSFAKDFIDALKPILSNEPATSDEVAILVRSQLRSYEGHMPRATENTPPFLLDLAGPLIGPERDEASIDLFLKKYKKELANPPKTGKGLHKLLVKAYLRSSPTEVTAFRDLVTKLKSLADRQIEMRDQVIDSLRKNVKGTPGRKKDTSWDLSLIVANSDKLRPVWEKIFELSKDSKQPLPVIVKAAKNLHPEWKTECDFLLANQELVTRSMKLSRIRKAKTRGKAAMLATALACKFAGYDAGPSYSMQLVEQARRSQKKSICP